jgi:hypothetical protein
MTCPRCGETRQCEIIPGARLGSGTGARTAATWYCQTCGRSGRVVLRRCMNGDHLFTAMSTTTQCPECAREKGGGDGESE